MRGDKLKIKHRYTFYYENENDEIVKFLKSNDILFNVSKGIPLVTIEMFEHNPLWSDLNEIMKRNNVDSLIYKSFTNKELEQSEWFNLWAKKHILYPQPEDDFGYESITYENKNYCDLCGSGLIQKDDFQLLHSPNWGNKNFLMLNWVHDEIFISNNVNESITNTNLQGFTIEKVKHYKTKQYFYDVFQIKITDTLDNGMIFDKNDVIIENHCSKCGSIKRIVSGKYLIKYNHGVFINKANDIYKSYEAFGEGKEHFKSIIISKQMYLFLKNKNYLSDFDVEPIVLI